MAENWLRNLLARLGRLMSTNKSWFSLNPFFGERNFSEINRCSFLITGGTGVLGYALLVLLKKIGVVNLHCLTRSPPLPCHIVEGVTYHNMDLRDANSLDKNLTHFDYIIHSAGYAQPNKFMQDPLGVFSINVDATRILINKCIKGFGFISSSEIYSGNVGILNELSEGKTNPQHRRACYIESKRSGEFLTSAISTSLNLDAKIFRVSTAYGPGFSKSDDRVLTDFIRNGLNNAFIHVRAGADQVRQVNYNFDAAQKIIIALLFGRNNVYNISGSNRLSIGEMAKVIAKITGANYEISTSRDQTGAPQLVDIVDKNFLDEFCFNIESDFEYIIRQSIDWFKKTN